MCSFSVIFLLILVNRPIYFYHQPQLMTVKINNEPINHMLAAKMKSIYAVISQILPEILL